MVDPVLNFGKAIVSIGYDDVAVSIVLTSGNGARFPDPGVSGAFNLVWYDSSLYPDPSDDPNHEIVRCTARSTDILTITRAQEGTSNTTKNTVGSTYKMILTLTKKAYDDLAALSTNIALNDLTDVIITSPTIDEVIKYNGSVWINSAPPTASVGPGVIFFLDDTKIYPVGAGPETIAMESLVKSPTTAIEDDEFTTVNNSTVLIDQYLYNTGLGVTQIDSGEWLFNTFGYVNDASGISTIVTSISKVVLKTGTVAITGTGTSRTATVSGATPFVAGDFSVDITQTGYIYTPNAVLKIIGFTSDAIVTVETLSTYTNETGVVYSIGYYLFQGESSEINNTTVGEVNYLTTQPTFITNITDKLAARYYGRTNNVGNIVVHFTHNGTTHYTHFHTPLVLTHNELSSIQGGSVGQYYHLTAAEYTGTGTGVFVRTTAPTLASSVTIGTPSSATGTILLNGKSSGTVTIKTADDAGTYALTLPIDDGTNGQFLETDGSGILSWATAEGAGDVTASSNLTDLAIVKGDGGGKGVKTTGISIADTTNNVTGMGTLACGAITGGTYNGNTITTGTGILTLDIGKTLTISNTITLTATDGSTLGIGTGGNLGTAAYTASTDYQPSDATLTSIALLGTVADKMIYTTNVDTWSETSITAQGRSLVAGVDAAAQRVTLGDVIPSTPTGGNKKITNIYYNVSVGEVVYEVEP